ncbi:MAG: hypothetical protein RIK87_03400 [Fuerstiella sp.]
MQKQTVTCADARHLVHLAVGDDTLPAEEQQLTDHLHSCADCRAYHAGMVDAMHVIEQVRDEDSVDIPAGAVWSAISDKVASRRRAKAVPQRRRFNGSVAALCACSLTLALVTIVQRLPTNSPEPDGWYAPVSATSVRHANGTGNQFQQAKIVPVRRPDGSTVWVDPATNQVYVPDVLNLLATDQDVDF